MTDSNEERIRTRKHVGEIFGIEIMLAILQTYAKGFEPAFTFSDVTGPSGSYKEHGLLSMQHQWLEQRAAERKWAIWAEAGLANKILKLWWLNILQQLHQWQ